MLVKMLCWLQKQKIRVCLHSFFTNGDLCTGHPIDAKLIMAQVTGRSSKKSVKKSGSSLSQLQIDELIFAINSQETSQG